MNKLITVTIMTASVLSSSADDIKYPQAPVSNTEDIYFGKKVSDPYRSLENDTSSSTLKWVEDERKVTEDYLSKIPFRNNLRQRLKTLMDYRKSDIPSKLKNDGKILFL